MMETASCFFISVSMTWIRNYFPAKCKKGVANLEAKQQSQWCTGCSCTDPTQRRLTQTSEEWLTFTSWEIRGTPRQGRTDNKQGLTSQQGRSKMTTSQKYYCREKHQEKASFQYSPWDCPSTASSPATSDVFLSVCRMLAGIFQHLMFY